MERGFGNNSNRLPVGPDGKPATPFPRLLFLCTRVLPVVCAAGALHLTAMNYLYPMSEEQRQDLERRRNAPRAPLPDRSAVSSGRPARRDDAPIDDTALLSDDGGSLDIDLSHLDHNPDRHQDPK